MGPTRKRDLTAAVVVAAVIGYLLVVGLYRWFPPITVFTGISLLGVAAAEALWGRHVRVPSRSAGGSVCWPTSCRSGAPCAWPARTPPGRSWRPPARWR